MSFLSQKARAPVTSPDEAPTIIPLLLMLRASLFGYPLKGAQVRKMACLPETGMIKPIPGVGETDDLLVCVNAVRPTVLAACQRAKIRRSAVLPETSVLVLVYGSKPEPTIAPRLLIPYASLLPPPSVPRSWSWPFCYRTACRTRRFAVRPGSACTAHYLSNT